MRISYCTRMKYNGCDKNRRQKYQLLNHVEVMKVYTIAIYIYLLQYIYLSYIVTVDGGGGQFWAATLDLFGY